MCLRFRAAGGTHLFLATQNYAPELPHDLAGYEEQFRTTIDLAATIERAARDKYDRTSRRAYEVVIVTTADLGLSAG